MTFKLELTKTKDTASRRFRSIDRDLNRGIRKGFQSIGKIQVKEIRKQVKTGTKSGRLYRIKGRLHRASAPGQTPANLSGLYQRSASYDVIGYRELNWGIEQPAYYAGYLEDGTSKMEARPGVKNSYQKTKGLSQQLFNRQVLRSLK